MTVLIDLPKDRKIDAFNWIKRHLLTLAIEKTTNLTEIGRILGLTRHSVARLIKKYKISLDVPIGVILVDEKVKVFRETAHSISKIEFGKIDHSLVRKLRLIAFDEDRANIVNWLENNFQKMTAPLLLNECVKKFEVNFDSGPHNKPEHWIHREIKRIYAV